MSLLVCQQFPMRKYEDVEITLSSPLMITPNLPSHYYQARTCARRSHLAQSPPSESGDKVRSTYFVLLFLASAYAVELCLGSYFRYLLWVILIYPPLMYDRTRC